MAMMSGGSDGLQQGRLEEGPSGEEAACVQRVPPWRGTAAGQYGCRDEGRDSRILDRRVKRTRRGGRVGGWWLEKSFECAREGGLRVRREREVPRACQATHGPPFGICSAEVTWFSRQDSGKQQAAVTTNHWPPSTTDQLSPETSA